MKSSISNELAVLAVLRAAKDAGARGLSRTALIKFVYLLDCLHAARHDGEIASRSEWFFHLYGPYAEDLAASVDRMASRGIIQSASGEMGDRDFTNYWLGEYPLGPSLGDLGLDGTSAQRFESLIRKYMVDLPRLLDYTYFHTSPMSIATPGRALDFSSCQIDAGVEPPRRVGVQDQEKIMRMAVLAHTIRERYAQPADNSKAVKAHRPIYDEKFQRFMAETSGVETDDASLPFSADLA